MLYAGLDLSRQRLDVHVLDEDGRTVEVLAVRPDADALRTLAARYEGPVNAVLESMNGARFVHDELERHGWDVAVADGRKTRGLAPLAAKTDKIDARVLAELGRRELVPAIWLPDPGTREARERSRFRLHLVRHRSSLKSRIHATLITFGHPSSSATPGSARWSTSRGGATGEDRSRRPGPSTCAGRSSKPPSTPHAIPATAADTSARSAGSASSAVSGSRGWSSLAIWPPPSGTCSPAVSRSGQQAPQVSWSLDDPRLTWAAAVSHRPDPPQRRQIET